MYFFWLMPMAAAGFVFFHINEELMAENFTPGETVPLTATIAGASVSFALVQSVAYTDCMVTNTGTVTAYVGFGTTQALVPTTGGTANATPVLPGSSVVLRKGNTTQCNAICANSTTSLLFTAGQGS